MPGGPDRRQGGRSGPRRDAGSAVRRDHPSDRWRAGRGLVRDVWRQSRILFQIFQNRAGWPGRLSFPVRRRMPGRRPPPVAGASVWPAKDFWNVSNFAQTGTAQRAWCKGRARRLSIVSVLLTSPRGGQDQFADSPGHRGVVITLMAGVQAISRPAFCVRNPLKKILAPWAHASVADARRERPSG
jgi:hypothetical protein